MLVSNPSYKSQFRWAEVTADRPKSVLSLAVFDGQYRKQARSEQAGETVARRNLALRFGKTGP